MSVARLTCGAAEQRVRAATRTRRSPGSRASRVAERSERLGHRLVDDLEVAAAGELLELHEREVGLDAGRVAVHQEADRAGRREHGRLRVAVAVLLAERDGVVPVLARGAPERLAGTSSRSIGVGRVAVHAHDAQHRLAVLREARRTAPFAAAISALDRVGVAAHDRGERAGDRAPLVGVVRDAEQHEQRAEVRVAEAERAVVVAVLRDRASSGSSRSRPGSPAR